MDKFYIEIKPEDNKYKTGYMDSHGNISYEYIDKNIIINKQIMTNPLYLEIKNEIEKNKNVLKMGKIFTQVYRMRESNKILYVEGSLDDSKMSMKYSYKDFYYIVREKLDKYKAFAGHNVTLQASNDIETYASLVALIALHTNPIIVPDIDTMNSSTIEKVHSEVSGNEFKLWLDLQEYEYRNKVVDTSFLPPELNFNDYKVDYKRPIKIGITSSGSTSNPKVIYHDEDEIMKEIMTDKRDLRGNDTFLYFPTQLNAISSLINSFAKPLFQNYKVFLDKNDVMKMPKSDSFANVYYKILKKHKITHTMISKKFIELVPQSVLDNQSFKGLREVFFAGETFDEPVYNKLKYQFKDFNINNLLIIYGSSEAAGVISYNNDIDNSSIYIDFDLLNKGKLICSKDKTNSNLVRIFSCGTAINKKVSLDINNNIFNKNGIKNIGAICFEDLNGNKSKTNDLGFILNNQIYVLGRDKDYISYNNKYYYLPLLEQKLRFLSMDTPIIINKNDTNKLDIYIFYNGDIGDPNILGKNNKTTKLIDSFIESNNIKGLFNKKYFLKNSYYPSSKGSVKLLKNNIEKSLSMQEEHDKKDKNKFDFETKGYTYKIDKFKKFITLLLENNNIKFIELINDIKLNDDNYEICYSKHDESYANIFIKLCKENKYCNYIKKDNDKVILSIKDKIILDKENRRKEEENEYFLKLDKVVNLNSLIVDYLKGITNKEINLYYKADFLNKINLCNKKELVKELSELSKFINKNSLFIENIYLSINNGLDINFKTILSDDIYTFNNIEASIFNLDKFKKVGLIGKSRLSKYKELYNNEKNYNKVRNRLEAAKLFYIIDGMTYEYEINSYIERLGITSEEINNLVNIYKKCKDKNYFYANLVDYNDIDKLVEIIKYYSNREETKEKLNKSFKERYNR